MPLHPSPSELTPGERFVAGVVLSGALVLTVALLGAPVLALVLPAVLLAGARLVETLARLPDPERVIDRFRR